MSSYGGRRLLPTCFRCFGSSPASSSPASSASEPPLSAAQHSERALARNPPHRSSSSSRTRRPARLSCSAASSLTLSRKVTHVHALWRRSLRSPRLAPLARRGGGRGRGGGRDSRRGWLFRVSSHLASELGDSCSNSTGHRRSAPPRHRLPAELARVTGVRTLDINGGSPLELFLAARLFVCSPECEPWFLSSPSVLLDCNVPARRGGFDWLGCHCARAAVYVSACLPGPRGAAV